MKTFLSLGILLILSFNALKAQGIEVIEHCDADDERSELKVAIFPYKPEYAKNFTFVYRPYDQIKEFEISLSPGDDYRFVFNLNGMPLDAKILITDKYRTNKRANVLWEYSGEKISVYDINATDEECPTKIYVAILIPAVEPGAENVVEKACIGFLYGKKPMLDEAFYR